MRRFLFLVLFVFPVIVFCQCLGGDCVGGAGAFKFKNGTYEGGFLESKPHGEGVFSTKRGHSYSGSWNLGLKSGNGKEVIKKRLVYEGDFLNNLKNGEGRAFFSDNKYMKNIVYSGEWTNGVPCGLGEMTYHREVRVNRQKIVEKHVLGGSFVNGVYQGRLTGPYQDELSWAPFILEMTDFQKHGDINSKERKRQKNPAKIEASIALTCECIGNTLLFDAGAIFRKEQSSWSTKDVPVKTKPEVLNTMQREFDIVEWHATSLENKLNKEKLTCQASSLDVVWLEWGFASKECERVQKEYSAETSWLPLKGKPKNTKVQLKWDRKIAKKLKTTQKASDKLISKIRKKLKSPDVGCVEIDMDVNISPIYPELIVKDENLKAKEPKEKKSFVPTFPRRSHLE
tara:strand:+ start:305 stop:1501 length:1197 start_codon:yes stop_codon:yes gene_type:complete